MKRCPVCEKTFDDNMRFCQSDGTPLVEDAAPVDPYKTMVARPGEIAAAIPPTFNEPSEPEQPIEPPSKDEGEVLQLPVEPDPLKTMFASEDEIRKEMEMRDAAENQVIDIPPLTEAAPPEPPKFSEPSLSPPSFGDVSPPPSPFSSASEPPPASELPFSKTSPPIPSPFSGPKTSSYKPPAAPETPRFVEPAPPAAEPEFNPFNSPLNAPPKQSMAPAEWTPPPAPESGWQNQPIGQNTPFQPPPAGGSGQNQTLAIISLVAGILGLLFCGGLTSPIALITGFMARRKAAANPAEYGGETLALVGIILGALGTLVLMLVLLYIVFVIVMGAGMALSS